MILVKFLIYIIFFHICLSKIGLVNNINTININDLNELLNIRDLQKIDIDEAIGYANFIFEEGKKYSDMRIARLPISLKENFYVRLAELLPKNKIESIIITYNTAYMSRYIANAIFISIVLGIVIKIISNYLMLSYHDIEKPGEFTIVKNPEIKFKDVIGLEPIKEDLKQIVDMINNREKYFEFGCKIPKGLIFSGPPGCGKTLFAKAIAGEAGVPFISACGGDFIEIYVGTGAARVRKLFKLAREYAPCIVFIDEIDSIGKSRKKNYTTNSEQDNTLNSLLNEMDGFKENDNIIVIAATNLYKTLDAALIRSGRFDRKIIFDYPNKKEREQLFELYLNKIKVDESITQNKEKYIKLLAERTAGMSGADIQNIINNAICGFMKRTMNPVKSLVDKIVHTKVIDTSIKNIKNIDNIKNSISGATFKDLELGMDEISLGMIKRERSMSDKEKEVTAHHEAGHAILSYVLKEISSPVRVSIIPRGEASLGVTQYEPNDNKMETKEQLLARMSMAYGGRIAEEVEFNQITTGAGSDISAITNIAYAMVTYYGMNDTIGEIDTMSNENPYKDIISDKTKEKIDQEVKQLKDKVRKGSYILMQKYKTKMEKIAKFLLDNEEMNKTDFVDMFKDEPIENTESIKDYVY